MPRFAMTKADDDRDLVKAAREGDPGAFEQLVQRHARAAARLAGRLTGNREDAEDVVQEAFSKAFQHLQTFQEEATFRTWLLRILMHQAHDLLRRRSRAPSYADLPPSSEPTDGQAGPAREAEAREQVITLRHAVDDLPTRQKAALFLKVYEGMNYRDVAAVLGTTASAARVYVWLARQSLRRRFHPLPDEPLHDEGGER